MHYTAARRTLKRPFVTAGSGGEWVEGEAVSGVSYKSNDGVDRVALAHLTIVCDGMYSNLRKSLADPKV